MPGRTDHVQSPTTGAVPFALGQATNVRIPIPGTNGLAIEFRPRNFKGLSTSTIFYQDAVGKRHLRLDYGFNVKSNTIDYHWNQRGVAGNFGITNHQTAGRGGQIGYNATKAFRYAGRPLLIVGAALDAVSIVQSNKPLRRATEVVSAWAGAWAGCKVVGALGAAGGSAVAPGPGTGIGGVGGCIIGGVGGYFAGETIARYVYQWAEDTIFTPLPQVQP